MQRGALFLLLFAATAWARHGPSELLFGEIRVSDLPGQDVILLSKCARSWNEPVDRLILEVRGADAYVYDLALRDDLGETRVISVRDTLQAQPHPHYIDLGAPICVTRLEFVPDPTIPRRPPGQQPVVTVTGKVATPEPAPAAP